MLAEFFFYQKALSYTLNRYIYPERVQKKIWFMVPLSSSLLGETDRVGQGKWVDLGLDWRRQWQSTPVFLPGESQGRGSLVGCRLWGRTESDTTEATQQQQQQQQQGQISPTEVMDSRTKVDKGIFPGVLIERTSRPGTQTLGVDGVAELSLCDRTQYASGQRYKGPRFSSQVEYLTLGRLTRGIKLQCASQRCEGDSGKQHLSTCISIPCINFVRLLIALGVKQ